MAKRLMMRISLVLVMAIAALVPLTQTALAKVTWCNEDPIVFIGGVEVHVDVYLAAESFGDRGIILQVETPEGVPAGVPIAQPPGTPPTNIMFSTDDDLRVTRKWIQVEFTVRVTGDDDTKAKVVISAGGAVLATRMGETGKEIKVKVNIPR
mgnify:CR=1 FL=1